MKSSGQNKSDQSVSEKRQYLRLESVFPVEFSFARSAQATQTLDWHQGFTSNISKGGICLSVHIASEDIKKLLDTRGMPLQLRIGIPLGARSIKASADIMWSEHLKEVAPERYLVGLKFTNIDGKDLNRMLFHAQWIHFRLKAAVGIALFFVLAFAASALYNFSLREANKKLINTLVTTQQQETMATYSLKGIAYEKEALARQLEEYAGRMKDLEAQLLVAQEAISAKSQTEVELNGQLQASTEKVDGLKKQIADLIRRKSPLENEYAALLKKENMMADEFALLEHKKEGLQKTVVQKMYRWIKNHQSSATGLVLSFEGDVGIIEHWAFSYDQALAVNAFLLFGDIESARKILNFFVRKLNDDFDGFVNGYYFDSGQISEYTVHVGPNTWLGIAALQYIEKTKDTEYLTLAKKIGDWLISIQEQDPAGGLRGGPQFSWFSTEHNLDAYAFFGMLYQHTKEEKYALAQRKVFDWLKTYALIPHSPDYRRPPVKRGRGDSTIATDTFAWALAAIGPERLIAAGMDPEEIMRFAEEHCAVSVDFKRPSGMNVTLNGFDFAKKTHMPRGGMVSPEWTSQMIVSYQILGDFFTQKDNTVKANYYKEKAKMYLNELNKIIIASPSLTGQGEGCLPYATLEDADTGHGWRTPHGTTTGSIAGTAYMIMAIQGFNPLSLSQYDIVSE
ncbi:MAG: PilZ domain-containing protein [Candidatus Omnitrophota bacterium]